MGLRTRLSQHESNIARSVRSVVFSILMVSYLLGWCQLAIKPIALKGQKTDTIVNSLPFWDDFSTSVSSPDTLKWQYGQSVFVNATLGIQPPTFNVATFDGLDGNGGAYGIESTFRGQTDSLISQPIDLSSADQNSTFLSFYWQAQGFGEQPDADDSLRLQFLAEDSTWVTKWVIQGGIESVFNQFLQVILQVDDESFFHDNFRLKFASYASQRGPFDTWHIDYIYLNENRNRSDLGHFDRALSGTLSPLFAPYFEVPADHYLRGDRLFSPQSVIVTNLDFQPHPLDYFYVLRNETLGFDYINASLGNGGFGLMDGLETKVVIGPFSLPGDSLLDHNAVLDSQVISSTFYYRTGDKFLFEEISNTGDTIFLPVDLKQNDTLSQSYVFHEHYAYDDGIAEFAAGINLLRGQVAIRFIIPEPDTLTHFQIYFPDIAPESSGNPIDLLVWRDELGENNERIRQPYTVTKSNGLNQFTEIKLNSKLVVTDTFHIGYQQFSDNFIAIGFDRNNVNAKDELFVNTTGDWIQNERLNGVLMIRPVFKSGDTTQILSSLPKIEDHFNIFPNPTSGFFSISGEYDEIVIYSLSGKKCFQSKYQSQYRTSFFEKGIFLIQILKDEKVYTRKLLIK